MARRPNSVKTASLLVRNPPGLGNHTCRGPHGLNPAVNGPQGNEYSGRHTESKDQIHQCGGQQSQRHETSDIHPISQETVYKLAHCISDEQGRSNDSKLCLGKCSRVHDRLFNHIQAKPAYIVYSIGTPATEAGYIFYLLMSSIFILLLSQLHCHECPWPMLPLPA